METYILKLNDGNNFISIPLDITSQDPRILFDPLKRNHNDTKYMYESIRTNGEAIFNTDGVWQGNLTQISPLKSYWIFSSDTHDKTFEGTALNPATLSYKLEEGNNYVSYPHTVTHDLGLSLIHI